MDFDFNSDQSLLAQSLNRWASDHMEIPSTLQGAVYLPGEALAEELAGQGYLETACQPEFGTLGGVLLIEAVGRTPWATEVNVSGLVAPMLGLPDLPRPIAIIEATNPVARFLRPGGAALIDAGDHLRLLRCCDERVTPVQNLYPYPFGRFEGDLIEASERLDHVRLDEFRGWRGLATLAEALGAMDSALKLTLDYVRSRVQFRRAIGSFQSVQHKLAECTSLVHASRLLTYRAAVEGFGFLGNALNHAHLAGARVAQDATQFHGALGQTLEYPLHLWVYRLRVLQFEVFTAISRELGLNSP